MNRFVTIQQPLRGQHYGEFGIPVQYAVNETASEFLGAGLKGIVRKFDLQNGSSIVIKKFRRFDCKSHGQPILHELNLLSITPHENIVRLVLPYTIPQPDNESFYYATEYCGEPLSVIIGKGQYSMEDCKKWTRELLRAVQHLHTHGVIIGNVRPDNICINSHKKLTLLGYKARGYNMDFGFVSCSQDDIGHWPLAYMPLDLLLGFAEEYDAKVDIWSVAAVVCEIITGPPLFFSEKPRDHPINLQIEYCGSIGEDMLNKIEDKNTVDYLRRLSVGKERKDFISILREQMMPGRVIRDADILMHEHPLRGFIDHTLQFNPECRMSAKQALAHDFLLHPWDQLPADDDQAMDVLRASLASEIAAVL